MRKPGSRSERNEVYAVLFRKENASMEIAVNFLMMSK